MPATYKFTFEDGSEVIAHYGVKGMKHGKHVKATDPSYLLSLGLISPEQAAQMIGEGVGDIAENVQDVANQVAEKADLKKFVDDAKDKASNLEKISQEARDKLKSRFENFSKEAEAKLKPFEKEYEKISDRAKQMVESNAQAGSLAKASKESKSQVIQDLYRIANERPEDKDRSKKYNQLRDPTVRLTAQAVDELVYQPHVKPKIEKMKEDAEKAKAFKNAPESDISQRRTSVKDYNDAAADVADEYRRTHSIPERIAKAVQNGGKLATTDEVNAELERRRRYGNYAKGFRGGRSGKF